MEFRERSLEEFKEILKKNIIKLLKQKLKYKKNINPTYVFCTVDKEDKIDMSEVKPNFNSDHDKSVARMALVETAKSIGRDFFQGKQKLSHFIMFSEAYSVIINASDYTDEEMEEITNNISPSDDPLSKDVLIVTLEYKNNQLFCMYDVSDLEKNGIDESKIDIIHAEYEDNKSDEYDGEQFILNKHNVFD
jgi:hypothetical protein